MADIFHRVGIKAPVQKCYEALASIEGIAGWWTEDTSGTPEIGNTIVVRFFTPGKEVGSMNTEVVAQEPGKKVQWKFTAGPEEWMERKAFTARYQDR